MKFLIFNVKEIDLFYRDKVLRIIYFFFKFFVIDVKIEIYFLNYDSIKNINFKFRGYFKATDSISVKNLNNFCIYFCFNYLIHKSYFLNKNIFNEFFFSFSHSILHNLKYNHEISYFELKKQNIIEKKIFKFFFN